MDLTAFFSVFGVIFLAELPDKTALAAVVMATRHRAFLVWLATALALTIQSVVAVVAGTLLSRLPTHAVHIGTGIVFLLSAVWMWIRKEDDEDDKKDDEPASDWKTFVTVLTVIFIAEWGDLTQIGTAALAARYKAPFTVLLASTLALWSVAAIAVFVGNRAKKFLDPNVVKKIAAVVFALVGIALIAGWL